MVASYQFLKLIFKMATLNGSVKPERWKQGSKYIRYGKAETKHLLYRKRLYLGGTWGIVLAGFADLPFCIVRLITPSVFKVSLKLASALYYPKWAPVIKVHVSQNRYCEKKPQVHNNGSSLQVRH